MLTDYQKELCAMVAHEANRAYCIAIGDNSQLSWDNSDWQRKSAVNGIESVLNGSTPEQQHQHWMDDKIKDGWKYGTVKDPVKKEHPCLVQYIELPDEQKRKDNLYISVIQAMVKALL